MVKIKKYLEYLGLWEEPYNPNFKKIECESLKLKSSQNSFAISLDNWIKTTNAIGIKSIKITKKYNLHTYMSAKLIF